MLVPFAMVWLSETDCAAATGTLEGTVIMKKGPLWVYIDGEGPQPASPGDVTVGQTQRQFDQNVLVIVRDTTVDFLNNGPEIHNIYAASDAARFNLGSYSAGLSRPHIFDQAGEVAVQCNIHAEMRLDVLVVPNTWWTQVDAQGHFRIKDITPGQHTVVVWGRGVSMRLQEDIQAGQTTKVNFSLHSGIK